MSKIKIQALADFVNNFDNAVQQSHLNGASLSVSVIDNGHDCTMHHRSVLREAQTFATASPIHVFTWSLRPVCSALGNKKNSKWATSLNFGCDLSYGSTKCSISANVNSLTLIGPCRGAICCPNIERWNRIRTHCLDSSIFLVEQEVSSKLIFPGWQIPIILHRKLKNNTLNTLTVMSILVKPT